MSQSHTFQDLVLIAQATKDAIKYAEPGDVHTLRDVSDMLHAVICNDIAKILGDNGIPLYTELSALSTIASSLTEPKLI